MKKTFSILMAALTVLSGTNLSSVSARQAPDDYPTEVLAPHTDLDIRIQSFLNDLQDLHQSLPWFNMEILNATFDIINQNTNIINEANARSHYSFFVYLDTLQRNRQIHNEYIDTAYAYFEGDIIGHMQDIIRIFNRHFSELLTQGIPMSEITDGIRQAM